MVCLQSNVSLSHANTLNLPCVASKYLCLSNEKDVLDVFNHFPLNEKNVLVLGGGSNVILPPFIDRYVLCFETQAAKDGAALIEEDQETVLLEVNAGVEWDDLVAYTVEKNYSGIENLSLIPGTVGAAPIQNIGAYGVEIADSLEALSAYNLSTQTIEHFSTKQCEFAYRDSVFKRNPGKFVIISMRFRLSKIPKFVLDYGELSVLKQHKSLTSKDLRDAVIKTRQAKLPNPKILPNAGSFFKNPVVSSQQAAELKQGFPNLVSYPLASGEFKLAAAWLIDQAGWKGYRDSHVGVHDKQALVIVNHQQGSQSDIISLAKSVQDSVHSKFGVSLQIEPVII